MKIFIFSAFTLLIISCNNPKKKQEINIRKSQLSIVKKHDTFISIQSNSSKNISKWKEYNFLNEFINRYNSISANEALNNALELANLIKNLKDSIRPKDLLTSSFITRINVLENEALRLKDMTYISAITAKEVNNQVAKVLDAYSATNSKINTVYNQLEIEKEMDSKNIDLKTKNTPVLKRQKHQFKNKKIPNRRHQK